MEVEKPRVFVSGDTRIHLYMSGEAFLKDKYSTRKFLPSLTVETIIEWGYTEVTND